MSDSTSPYAKLEMHFAELHQIEHAQAMLSWDEAVIMPPGGGTERGEALAALAAIAHRALTTDAVGNLLNAAEAGSDPLSQWQQANLRAMRRMHTRAVAVPEDIVRASQVAAARCQQIWRVARAENDWKAVAEPLAEVLALAREEAAALGEALALDPYDALLDGYEEGTRADDVVPLFDDLKGFLPGLVDRVLARQRSPLPLPGPFPQDGQNRLGEEMMRRLGFDFARGRLDISHHPFCGGVPDDTRITTRYSDTDFLESFMAVLHETGHALYQQGLPADWRQQPVGNCLGAAVHESQSLFVEMQISRSSSFMEFAAPHIRHHLGGGQDDDAWTADNLHAHAICVRRDYIRVEADELTYPLHVILRFELERALIAGDLSVADIPDAWNDGMSRYLGLSTDGNFKDGCMQDVHWFSGLFGYFPTYTLGALVAAQWFAAATRCLPDIETSIRTGDFAPVVSWLRKEIHSRGQLKTARELLTEITGEPLNIRYFKDHLERRYLG
ncbi:carboxypeptidase M32 [Methyloceanibacter sp. wino2]|uniref:carboxypeptidase M32 n=1 Tax=Methyloceanibacter sp. wino2 TaxID=2170729 RepID=UPI00352D8632